MVTTATIVNLTSAWSDGDLSRQPNPSDGFQSTPPNLYLEKVGQMWMEHRYEAERGKKYILDRLPVGYQLFGKRRGNNSTHVDRYLYGHPSGKGFNSPAQFFSHFLFLMGSGDGVCSCALCQAGVRRTANERGAARSAAEEPSLLHLALSQRLEKALHLDEDIVENQSPTWRANRQNLRIELAKCVEQPAFVPRKGEVVLFYCERPLQGQINIDRRSVDPAFRFYEHETGEYLGFPEWEAGVVVQVPNRELSPEDLFKPKIPDTEVFKVVPYLGPSQGPDKLLPEEAVKVSLHQMRPFCYLAEMMSGIKMDDYDESIWQALDIMASFALVDKHRLVTDWPAAVVHCRAAWVGPELLACGDAVRVWDDSGIKVLVLESIEMRIENLDAERSMVRSGIWFTGRAYSSSPTHFTSVRVPEEEVVARLPRGMQRYEWYPVHSANQVYRANLSNVIGRCYEAIALQTWLFSTPSVSIGSEVVKWARQNRVSRDERKKRGHEWYWADYRLEQLNVTSLRLFGMDEPDLRAVRRLWNQVVVQTATEASFRAEPNAFEIRSSVVGGTPSNDQGVIK